MTMGLKVRELLNEKKIKEKAKARKDESDAILDNIYSLLMDKKPSKKMVPKKVDQ
jgi:hypothetical protein